MDPATITIIGGVVVALFTFLSKAISPIVKLIIFLLTGIFIAVVGFGVSIGLLFNSIPWPVWVIGVGILIISMAFGKK